MSCSAKAQINSLKGSRERLALSVFSLLFALALAISMQLMALAETTVLNAQAVRQGDANRWKPREPQLDTASPTFILKETKKRVQPSGASSKTSHGVVGLDLLIQKDRYPVVQAVFWGTPAQQQGVQAGDTIIAVNGVQTIDKSRAQVDVMISDVPGEVVDLTIVRDARMRHVQLTVAALEELPAALRGQFSSLFP